MQVSKHTLLTEMRGNQDCSWNIYDGSYDNLTIIKLHHNFLWKCIISLLFCRDTDKNEHWKANYSMKSFHFNKNLFHSVLFHMDEASNNVIVLTWFFFSWILLFSRWVASRLRHSFNPLTDSDSGPRLKSGWFNARGLTWCQLYRRGGVWKCERWLSATTVWLAVQQGYFHYQSFRFKIVIRFLYAV